MKEYVISIFIAEDFEKSRAEISTELYEDLIKSYPEGLVISVQGRSYNFTLDFLSDEEQFYKEEE